MSGATGDMAGEPSVEGLPDFCRLKETTVPLHGRSLAILSVGNVSELVDRADTVEELPFWAELWPSAIALSRFFGDADLKGRSLLELGSGVGLVGLAACLQGARVVQTDFVPLALEFCRANSARNGLPTERLLADWREFPSDRCYDVICGSDILYEPLLHPHLQRVFETVLSPGGTVFLSDPLRPHGDAFSRRMRAAGWKESLDLVQAPCSGQDGLEQTVAVYRFAR